MGSFQDAAWICSSSSKHYHMTMTMIYRDYTNEITSTFLSILNRLERQLGLYLRDFFVLVNGYFCRYFQLCGVVGTWKSDIGNLKLKRLLTYYCLWLMQGSTNLGKNCYWSYPKTCEIFKIQWDCAKIHYYTTVKV